MLPAKDSADRQRRGRPPRRGVLLLVVLSMLTLFLLLGTTFLILASRARTTAGAFLRLSEDQTSSTAAYTPFMREAAMQVIRGTKRDGSALVHHDLLGDRYGSVGGKKYGVENNDAPAGSSRAPEPPRFAAGDQVLRLRLRLLNSDESALEGDVPPGNLSGQTLTFLDGPEGVALTSARIITSLDADANNSAVVFIERPRGLATAASLIAGCSDGILEVWINDRDFAGAGLEPFDAFQPNWRAANRSNSSSPAINEGYDALDEQNLAISGSTPAGVLQASFHRPDFIDYWVRWCAQQDGHTSLPPSYEQDLAAVIRKPCVQLSETTEVQRAQLFRQATLRPFAFDHSPDGGSTDFTGKPLTPALALHPIRNKTLDVDVDGDGELDSVWLDLGLTPVTTPDRRLVKPLFAIRCIDLGGRLNLNAHGSPAHAADLNEADPLLAASGTGQPKLRWGAAFGPAAVRLDAVTGEPIFQRLIDGGGPFFGRSQGIRRDIGHQVGRYGGDTDAAGLALAGLPGDAWELWHSNPFTTWITTDRGLPANWTSSTAGPSLFAGGPPDLWSRVAVGIDRRGNAAYQNGEPAASDLANTPYALDLFRPKSAAPNAGTASADAWSSADAWVDQPFTAPELEAVLRPFDPDNAAVLPQRLLALDLSATSVLRDGCTTESWDTPAFIGGAPLPQGGLDDNTSGSSRLDYDRDLVRGLRMDLNRPFGNGADDDGDGIVDEPDESDLSKEGFQLSGSVAGSGTTAWHLTRGLLPLALRPGGALEQPGLDAPGLRARQLFAHHLFTLVEGVRTWAIEKNIVNSPGLWLCSGTWTTTSGSAAFKRRDPAILDSAFGLESHARQVIAQWAINVVDFMDADAIMTPFKYGPQPSSVVWGCEAPDLVITETLALHDRGIADDKEHGFTNLGTSGSDSGWDQVRRPRGSLFVELHAVRSPTVPIPPREIYETDGTLDLGRRPPTTSPNAAPIWRLSLTTARSTRTASNDIFKKILANPDTAWLKPDGATDTSIDGIGRDRYVWFTTGLPSSPVPAMPTTTNTFRLESSAASVRISRGDFLVVGPRQSTPFGGKKESPVGTPSPQEIILSENGATAAVRVPDFDGAINPTVSRPTNRSIGEPLPPPVDDSKPKGYRKESRACWVSMPVPGQAGVRSGLNISEQPISSYYPRPTGTGDAYVPPLNQPVTDSVLVRELKPQGTYANVATVFLERLADPTRPHEPNSTAAGWNPYMVVDFMPIDLTTFNGEASGAEKAIVGNEVVTLRPDGRMHFHTRQRGLVTDENGTPFGEFRLSDMLFGGTTALVANPWVPAYPSEVDHLPGPKSDQVGDSPAHFAYLLNKSSLDSEGCPIHTLGWSNISFGRRLGESEVPASMVGAPSTPWPWLVWNDRPFSSEYELLLVPRTPPGRFLTDYRNPSIDPPRGASKPPLQPRSLYDEFGVPLAAGHLLPFTAINDPPDADPADASAPKLSRNADLLCRLFSYVRVPSPFAGTRRGLRPWAGADLSDPMTGFLPPFNMLTTYREPGRVNINTIGFSGSGGSTVWNALLGGDSVPPAAPEWAGLKQVMNRQISGTFVHQPWRTITPGIRGTGTSAAVEIPLLLNPPLGSPATDPRQLSHDFSARSFTLLRTGTESASDGTPLSLFHPPRSAGKPSGSNQYTYAERNTWFAYEPLLRAATNTTVRSEVYAVWVTMGFFEVEAVTSSEAQNLPGTTVSMYPDGYRLLREHGSQTGDIRRHKAFYIFDRSVPIGYMPGEDLNVADGLIVERLVE